MNKQDLRLRLLSYKKKGFKLRLTGNVAELKKELERVTMEYEQSRRYYRFARQKVMEIQKKHY